MPESNFVRNRVSQLVAQLGPSEASRQLNMPKDMLVRIAAGVPVREASLLLAAQRLGLLISSSPLPLALSTLPQAGDPTSL